MAPPRILVVEDDPDLLDSICQFLMRVGLDARGATTGEHMDALLAEEAADIIVLDVNLPDETGFSVATRLRAARPEIGIIMLTGRDRLGDRVLGLQLGADSYLVKPVHLTELHAVTQSLSRRPPGRPPAAGAPQLPVPAAPTADQAAAPPDAGTTAWLLNRSSWSLTPPDGQPIVLTAAEFRVLDALASASGNSVPRESIAAALGKAKSDPEDRSIDAILTRLRRKTEETAGIPLPIRSVRGVGYAFTAAISVVAA